MPTIIDSLIVELALDPKGFAAGRRKADESMKGLRSDAERTSKELEARGKQAGEFFGQIRRGMLALGAVATGVTAMRIFGQQAAASDAQVGRLARNLGMVTERLDAYGRMAERVGGAREGLSSSLQSIQSQVNEPAIEGTAMNRYWAASGIHTVQPGPGRQQRPLEDIARDVVRYLRTIPETQQSDYARGMGVGQEFVGFARMSPADFEKQFQEVLRLGTVTKQQAEEAERLSKAWQALHQSLETTDRLMRDRFSGSVSDVLAAFTNLTDYLNGPEMKPIWDDLAAEVREFTKYLGSKEFRQDLEDFGKRIQRISQLILQAINWIEAKVTSWGVPGLTEPTGENALTRLYHALGITNRDGSVGSTPDRPGDARRPWNWLGQLFGVDPANAAAPGAGAEPSAGADVRPGTRRTPEQFSTEFGGMADRVAAQVGVSRDIILGQMAIESDWGRAFAGRNNPFNLTARPSADATVGGDTDGQRRPITQRFQNFATTDAAADEYAGRLRRLWPGSVGAGGDVARFAAGLRFGQQGGYASDPDGRYGFWLQNRAEMMRRAGKQAPPATAVAAQPLPLPPPPTPGPRDRDGNEQPLPNPSAPGPVQVPEVEVKPEAFLRDMRAFSLANLTAARSPVGRGSTTNTSDVSINGPITINTQARDAAGVARSLRDELARQMPRDMAATGVS